MTVTDELLANNRAYIVGFCSAPRRSSSSTAPTAACSPSPLTFTDDAFRASIQEDTGIKPEWAAEAFPDVDADVRQSINRIKASPFIPLTDAVRGFVYDVHTGRLREVS